MVVLTVGLLIASACGGSDNESRDETSTSSAATTTTTTAVGGDGIHVAETDLGSILVGPGGFTLYVFTVDANGESACYDACADLWPPVPANTAIGPDLDDSIFGTTSRTDGTEQLTVNGQPLYLYTPDVNPGDTNGQNFNSVWFVVDSSGAMIGNSEASNSDDTVLTSGDDGLDY